MRLISTRILIGMLAAVAAAACAGTGHVDVAVGATGSPLTAEGETAAEPPHLMVTVSRVDVHVSGDDDDDDGTEAKPDAEAETDDGDGDGGWVTVFTGPLEIDLRDAASGELLLGGADVSPGRVTEIRLVLAGEARLVNGAEVQTVRCPSCTSSGLKIKAQRAHIDVAEGETVRLTAVFDTVASVSVALDGLRLSPVIKLEAAASSQ